MVSELSYADVLSGEWRLKVLAANWSVDLWRHVLDRIRNELPSKHPRTVAFRFPDNSAGMHLFLKVYHPRLGVASWKNVLRESKGFRFLRQGQELSKAGFRVPRVIAAGEERCHQVLGRAFVLTLEIQGEVLPVFLRRNIIEFSGGAGFAEKRKAIEALAREIRCLHDLGFVHGDLVPSNIMVFRENETTLRFYLMDNDRTRRYPTWLPQTLWKRNLIQLNRLPLPGISLQDRMRFFRAYSGRHDWSRGNRGLLHWIERKTRKRRKECDAADLEVSFRRLMKWNRRGIDGR